MHSFGFVGKTLSWVPVSKGLHDDCVRKFTKPLLVTDQTTRELEAKLIHQSHSASPLRNIFVVNGGNTLQKQDVGV